MDKGNHERKETAVGLHAVRQLLWKKKIVPLFLSEGLEGWGVPQERKASRGGGGSLALHQSSASHVFGCLVSTA